MPNRTLCTDDFCAGKAFFGIAQAYSLATPYRLLGRWRLYPRASIRACRSGIGGRGRARQRSVVIDGRPQALGLIP
jgi:hypothetical protein